MYCTSFDNQQAAAHSVTYCVGGHLILLTCDWSPSVTRCGNETPRTRLIGLHLHVVSLSYADGLNKMRSLSTPAEETTTMKKKERSIWRPTEQQSEQQLDGTDKVDTKKRRLRQ